MQPSLNKLLRSRWAQLLIAGLFLGMAGRASAQSTAVVDYPTLITALKTSSTITNFGAVSNVTISLTTAGETIQVTSDVTIDGGTNAVVISGNNATRLFNVHPQVTLTLRNLQLTGGIATNGGAIYNAGNLVISNCIVYANSATNTSGVDGASGASGDNGSSGTSGSSGFGGAIYSLGPVSIFYSILTNNVASAGNGGNGGAGVSGDFVFGGNGGDGGSGGSAYGGALYSVGRSNIFYMTEFADNRCAAGSGGAGGSFGTAQFSGSGGSGGTGGSVAGGGAYVTGLLYMTNCLFYQNAVTGGATAPAEVDSDGSGGSGGSGGAASGGGLYISGASANADLENSIFYFNQCNGGAGGGSSVSGASAGGGGQALGGGLVSGATLTKMRFCTLATNTLIGGVGGTNSVGGTGGSAGGTTGWDIYSPGGARSFQIFGSILSGGANAAPNYTPNATGLVDEGYNISSDASLARLHSNTLLNTDPVLDSGLSAQGPLVGGPYGALLLTLALSPGSPGEAIVPGVPGITFPLTDEVLNLRQTPTTVGAFEMDPLTVPTNIVLPVISGPEDASTKTGQTAVFSVDVANDDGTFGYQWLFNGTNILSDNGTYSGATSDTLSVKVTFADEGYYSVIVSPSTAEGMTVSSNAALTVTDKPSIQTEPPRNLTAVAGSVVNLKVTSVGQLGFTYQWFFGATPVSDGGNIYGSTNSELTLNPVQLTNAGDYSVLISNAFGTMTSTTTTLKVAQDKAKPTVVITSPLVNSRVNSNTLVFKGTATDNAQVASVIYLLTNINSGITTAQLTGTAVLATNGTTTHPWSFSAQPTPGTNFLAVQSVDYSGNESAIVIRRFFYNSLATFTLTSVGGGSGVITGAAPFAGDTRPTNQAQLNIGETYTLVAKPNATSLFNGWTDTDGPTGSNATFKFVMGSNTVIEADFVTNMFIGQAGAFNGLFWDTNDLEFASAGLAHNLVLTRTGHYSGGLFLAGGTYPFAGNFNPSGASTFTVKRAAKLGGNIVFSLNLDPAFGQISGTAAGATPDGDPWTASLLAEHAAAGLGPIKFTALMLPPDADSGTPPGDGYALISVNNSIATMAGGLADGTTFSQTVPVSSTGDIPVFVNLYSRTGFLFGWLNLNSLGDFTQPLTWLKPASSSLLFPAGFTNLWQFQGSVWTVPAAKTPAINLSSGNLIVSNADLGLDLDFPVSLNVNQLVQTGSGSLTNAFSATVNPQNGLMQVTFGNGAGRSLSKGYGAILQDATNGGGYWVTKTNAGSMLLEP